MGAVNTTYTFTATDTITSTKMNDIIDQTTFTNDAVFDTTLAVASGKLKVNAQGITSNELSDNAVITSKISDLAVITTKIADSNVVTTKIADANVTQAKLAANTVGNGPCFRVGGDATAMNQFTTTKMTLTTKIFDTNNNVSSSRFTPTIAGYYQINGTCTGQSISLYELNCYIYKNGNNYSIGSVSTADVYTSVASAIVYMNGTTDYVELYSRHSETGTHGIIGFLDGVLVRSA